MIADFYIAGFIIAGVLSTIMGSIILFEASKIYRQALRSKQWNSTSGKISKVNVIEKEVSSTSKRKLFEAQIEYQYSVGGKEFKGDKQNIGNLNTLSRNKSKIESKLIKFKEDQDIMVYYNDSNPKISTLSVGVQKNHFKDFLFGLIFLFLGVSLFGLGIILLNH